jgi:hypothetical protein
MRKGEMMRKLLLLLTLMTAGAAIAAPGANADQPTITSAPSTDFVDTSCGFPVSVHFVVNNETAKTFTNGTTIITGPLFAELSANGKTITLNTSGPGTITVSGSSVMITIHGVAFGELLTPKGPVLVQTAGKVSVVSLSPPQGVLEHGKVLLNICSALAP